MLFNGVNGDCRRGDAFDTKVQKKRGLSFDTAIDNCISLKHLFICFQPSTILILICKKHQALVRMPFQLPLILLAYWHSLARPTKFIDHLSIIVFPPTIIYFLTI